MTTFNFDEKKIDEIFSPVNQSHLPGAAVGIALNGKPVYRKGFGLANMELPVVLSPSIRMRIGSITKHFAALAYMLLCEDGKAKLDDPIGTHLPELHPVTSRVTVRQLLGHTGGVRDALNLCWLFGGRARVTSEQMLAMYRDIDDVNFAPGTDWSYNNGGYLMVSSAIERISGKSLEDVLQDRIFEPIGMYASLLRRWDTDFVSNSATQHALDDDGKFVKGTLGVAIAGEGGIVSTVDDMLRWLAHMDAPVVGTDATWRMMRAPLTLQNGSSTNYGLGLTVGKYRGVETVRHGGGVAGGNSDMIKVPSAGVDIAIMVNRDGVLSSDLTNKILDVCLSDLESLERAVEKPVATGVFRSPTSDRVIELGSKDGVQSVSMDGFPVPFGPSEDGVLRTIGPYKFQPLSIRLSGDPQRPDAIEFRHFGNVDDLVAVPRPVAGSARPPVGEYRSESTGTTATISASAAGVQLLTQGLFASQRFDLNCLAADVWCSSLPGGSERGRAILSFARDGSSFRISNSNSRALPFQRVASGRP